MVRLGSVVSLTIALLAAFMAVAPPGLSAVGAQPAPSATSGPALEGVVWLDVDGDAIRDGDEAGIADLGVSLWALDSAGDPIAEVAATVTDGNGNYLLAPFAPGNYRVGVDVGERFRAPIELHDGFGPIVALASEAVDRFDVGLLPVEVVVPAAPEPESPSPEDVSNEATPDEPSADEPSAEQPALSDEVPAQPADPESASPERAEAPIADPIDAEAADNEHGENAQAEQFADPGAEAIVRGIVFEDVNLNGQREDDEPGFEDVTVELRDDADTVVAAGETDTEGRYTLVAPLTGTYFVHVIAPDETTFTRSNVGDDATDSDVDENGVALVTAQPGVDAVADAGLRRVASVRGTFWVDENENGQREVGEAPVVGLQVAAFDPDQQYFGETITDANGAYEIASLPPGNYSVLLYNGGQGVRFTTANVGDDATDSDFELPDRSARFELLSGEAVIDGGLLPSVVLQVSLSDGPGSGFGHRGVIRLGDITDSIYSNTIELAIAPFSSSLLELWLQPENAWAVRGLTCDGDVTTSWADLGSGYSQATLDVGAPGEVACVYDTTHLPSEPVSVTFDVVGPADTPPVPLQALRGYAGGEPYDQYATVIAPGQAETILLEPGGSSSQPLVRAERPPTGWELRLHCPANVPIEASGVSQLDFELDLLAVPGQAITCTFAMTQVQPATVEWTNTHTGLDSPTIYLSMNGRAVSTAQTATGSATVPISPGPFQTVARIDTATGSLDTFTCTVDGVVFEPSWRSGNRSIRVEVPDVAVGDAIECASTTSDPAKSSVTIVDDAGQMLDVHVRLISITPTFDYRVDGTATFDVPAGTTRLYFDVGPNRRFRDLICDQTPTSRPNPAIGFAEFDLTDTDLTCTVSSYDRPNPPVTVTLIPVSTDDTPLPPVALYADRFTATADVWDPEGVTRQHTLGVGDPTNGVIDGVLLRFTAPLGWVPNLDASQCDGSGVVSFGQFVSPAPAIVDVSGAEPGDAIRCEIAMDPPAETVPLTLTLDPGESGAIPDTEMRYSLGFEPPQSVAVSEPVGVVVARGTYLVVYPTVGYELARLSCDGLSDPDPYRSPSGSIGISTWWPEGEAPTSIDCAATLVASPPARVVMTAELRGAAGNGDVAFALSGRAFDNTVSINGAGSTTVDVPSTDFDVTATLPVTMRNLSVSCDRVFDIEVDGLTVELDMAPGETVECTFVNEMVSQDVGVPGDVTCDGVVDIIDALVIAQFEAQVRSGAASCPLGDATTQLFTGAADFDGSGGVDILDALQVARCTVGLPAPPCAEAFALD